MYVCLYVLAHCIDSYYVCFYSFVQLYCTAPCARNFFIGKYPYKTIKRLIIIITIIIMNIASIESPTNTPLESCERNDRRKKNR